MTGLIFKNIYIKIVKIMLSYIIKKHSSNLVPKHVLQLGLQQVPSEDTYYPLTLKK